MELHGTLRHFARISRPCRLRRSLFSVLFLFAFVTSGSGIFLTADLALVHASEPKVQENLQSQTSPRFSLDRRVSLKIVDDLHSPLYDITQLRHAKTEAERYLSEVEAELARVFDFRPKQSVTLQLLSRAQYREFIGSASWANAVYLGGVITAPLLGVDSASLQTFRKSLRHEYVHAVCAELSGGTPPAWFDEGIAQLIEGRVNSRLAPAFETLVKAGTLLPLASIEQGFTSLAPGQVPAAYAQSLFAVRSLVNRFGFKGIRAYLLELKRGRELKRGSNSERAFRLAFGLEQSEFEAALLRQAKSWLKSEDAVL